MSVDCDAYRQVMGRLATGVTVLSTLGADRDEVMTANAVVSVSLEPVLLLVSVRADCRWRQAARSAGRFAVNVLSEHQEQLSRWCADPERHVRPDEVRNHPCRVSATTGLLLFQEALASFECRMHAEYPAGDHDLLIGEVTDMWVRDAGSPLLFYRSAYGGLGAPSAQAWQVDVAV